MKKFLTFFAFAVLTAAACTMLTACGDDDDDDLPNVPQNVEQARRMVIGQWLNPDYDPEDYYDDVYCREFNEDGHYYLIMYIRPDAPDGEWFSNYKGKYVGYAHYGNYFIKPNSDDPTKGQITLYDDYEEVSEGWTRSYSNLSKSSLKWDGKDHKRPKKPVKYIKIANPYSSD